MEKRLHLEIRRLLRRFVDRHVLSDENLVKKQYFRKHGFFPDLDTPKDWTEKLQWLKLHDHSDLHTQCADKIRVRDYVAARLGPDLVIPALHITHDPSSLTPSTILAERFVVKTNHDQGGVFFCRDRASFDWEDVRRKVAKRLKTNKYKDFRERQYKDIRPGVLVENLIGREESGRPVEIKLFCFHGVPKLCHVILDRFGGRRDAFYDLDWTRIDCILPDPQIEGDLPRPESLDWLVQCASVLSDPFLFVRVDFLLGAGDRPWFGEITFHPGAGLNRVQPKELERALGDMIDLSRLGEPRRRRPVSGLQAQTSLRVISL